MNKRLTRVSKYLTFILRHEPGSIGVELDELGFTSIADLVAKAQASGKSITVELVLQVIDAQSPALFAVNEDRSQIRAL